MNIINVINNPDLFTYILSYLNKPNLKQIISTFKKYIHYDYISPTNNILLYGQVQSGKTNKIMNYITNYKTNIIKIIIIQNSVNMLEQYTFKLKEFNIKYKIINTNALSYSYNKEKVLITICNKYRINILLKYITQNNIKKYCLVLDESDQYLDKIINHTIFTNAKNTLHVTATPFKYNLIRYNKLLDIDNIIKLNTPSNYTGIQNIDIISINLFQELTTDDNYNIIIIKNNIINILNTDFFQNSTGFMLINCFTRLNKMINSATEFSILYNTIPFIVLSSNTYIIINGISKKIKVKNIQKFISSFNIYPHIVFIANKLSNRGVNFTTDTYSRYISHQISIPNGNYTSFLQKCRILGIRKEETNMKPKLYCLIKNHLHTSFVIKLQNKINNLFIKDTKDTKVEKPITVKQLKHLCRSNQIKGFSKLNKQGLIELLLHNNINY